MILRDLLQKISTRLSPVAGAFALPEAERLLGFLLNCSRSELYLQNRPLPPELERRIEPIIARRLTEEPLAYILGSAFFFHKEFSITPDVLIPRPDTEILVETVLRHEPRTRPLRFIDIGTGSGCIAAALKDHREHWNAIGIDRSFGALRIARKNCCPGIYLSCVNMLSSIKRKPLFDFIVSNPPYIKTGEVAALPASVRNFEPRVALDGGEDGLDFYRQLAESTPPLLVPGGRIYCEIGYDQGTTVPPIFSSAGWTSISVTKDLAGQDRVIRAIVAGI